MGREIRTYHAFIDQHELVRDCVRVIRVYEIEVFSPAVSGESWNVTQSKQSTVAKQWESQRYNCQRLSVNHDQLSLKHDQFEQNAGNFRTSIWTDEVTIIFCYYKALRKLSTRIVWSSHSCSNRQTFPIGLRSYTIRQQTAALTEVNKK